MTKTTLLTAFGMSIALVGSAFAQLVTTTPRTMAGLSEGQMALPSTAITALQNAGVPIPAGLIPRGPNVVMTREDYNQLISQARTVNAALASSVSAKALSPNSSKAVGSVRMMGQQSNRGYQAQVQPIGTAQRAQTDGTVTMAVGQNAKITLLPQAVSLANLQEAAALGVDANVIEAAKKQVVAGINDFGACPASKSWTKEEATGYILTDMYQMNFIRAGMAPKIALEKGLTEAHLPANRAASLCGGPCAKNLTLVCGI